MEAATYVWAQRITYSWVSVAGSLQIIEFAAKFKGTDDE